MELIGLNHAILFLTDCLQGACEDVSLNCFNQVWLFYLSFLCSVYFLLFLKWYVLFSKCFFFFSFLLYLGVSQFGKRPIFFSFCFCYEYLLCFFSFYVYFWIFVHDISYLVLLDFNFFFLL